MTVFYILTLIFFLLQSSINSSTLLHHPNAHRFISPLSNRSFFQQTMHNTSGSPGVNSFTSQSLRVIIFFNASGVPVSAPNDLKCIGTTVFVCSKNYIHHIPPSQAT